MAWKVLNMVAVVVFLAVLGLVGGDVANSTDSNSRSLKGFKLVGLFEGCPQGKQGINTWETMHNHHDHWEKAWGRTDASWPRRGFQSCWDNRGDTCQLPDQDHVVCLPGSRRGSTVNKGWALDPKAQACRPGVHCLYACEPGYYWTTFNDAETSNYDVVNGPKVGHCDGTWDYGTSTHGVYCKEDGQLAMPEQPLCMLGETYVYAENRLDTHVFLCQTVFPGHEIFLIPTLVKPGETVMITTQPKHFWSGPTYASPTHGDIYVGFAGADIMESCTWDEFSPSGASLLPYEIGSGVEDNGVVYSTHYYYQQPNSEVPANMVGYEMDLECESGEWGVCGGVFRNADVVKVDVLKKPSPGTTSVKFVFNPPHMRPKFEGMYKEPNKLYLTDPHIITSMKFYDMYDPNEYGGDTYEPTNGGGYHTFTGGSEYHGRKLKHVDSSFIFLENRLTESIVLCDKDAKKKIVPGISIGPGEKLQLSVGGNYHLSRRTKETRICGATELPWVLSTGDLSEADPNQSHYSYTRNKRAGDLSGHLDYTVTLKCSSSTDLCDSQSGREVNLLKSPLSDPDLSITYTVISNTKADESEDFVGKVSGIAKHFLNLFSMNRQMDAKYATA